MANHGSGVDQASPDVLWLEERVPFENRLGEVVGGEHAEHVLDRRPMPADDRFPAKDGGVSGASPKQRFFAHAGSVNSARATSLGLAPPRMVLPLPTCYPSI